MALRLREGAPNWQEGKCVGQARDEHTDLWYNEAAEALSVCNGEDDGLICPIRSACLAFALANKDNHGVWGGMQTCDRTALRRWGPASEQRWHPPTDPADPSTRRYRPPPAYLERLRAAGRRFEDDQDEEGAPWPQAQAGAA